MRHIKNTGFTLVELSIVIIIIGFLISGISAGTSLIKQAKLNAVISEKSEYFTAINTFKIKYSYLPGDIPYAKSIWTGAAANGNGDGQADWYKNTIDVREGLAGWQHLALAGLVNGTFTGVGEDVGNGAVGGLNVPSSKYNPGIWVIADTRNSEGLPSFGALETSGGFLLFGNHSYNNVNVVSVFVPSEAYNLDNKIDDGKPLSGAVFSGNGCISNSPTCNDVCVSGTAYAVLSSAVGCFTGFFHGIE